MEYYRTLTIYPIGSTLGPHFTPRKYNIIASHCGSCYLALSKWIHSAQTTCGIFTIAWPLPCFIAGGAWGLTWRSSSSLDWISIHSYTEYISIYVELLHVITLNITLNHIFLLPTLLYGNYMLLVITIIILPESYLSDFCTPGSRWIPGASHGRGPRLCPNVLNSQPRLALSQNAGFV